MLGKPEQYKFIEGFNGKLYGSEQPGFGVNNSSDERILQECKAGNQSSVDEKLLNNLKSIHADGITTIYSLAHPPVGRLPELVKYLWETNYPGSTYITELDGISTGIPDFSAPTLKQLTTITSDAISRMNAGEKILVHCGAGKGRTGTMLAAINIAATKNYDAQASIDYMRDNYSRYSVEEAAQAISLKKFAENLQKENLKFGLASDDISIRRKSLATCLDLDIRELILESLDYIKNISPILEICTHKGKDNGLKIAINQQNNSLAKQCITAGASPNCVDEAGISIFSKAIALNDDSLVRAFYANPSFDPNLKDAAGKSPLSYAVTSNNTELTKQLIIRGADITPAIIPKNKAKGYLKAAIDIGNLKAVNNILTSYPELYEQSLLNQSSHNPAVYLSILSLKPNPTNADKEHAHEFLSNNPSFIKDLILNAIDLSIFKDRGSLAAACTQFITEDNLLSYLKEAIDGDNFNHFKNLCSYAPSLKFQLIEDKNILTYTLENSGDRNDFAIKAADFGMVDDVHLNEENEDNGLKLAIILEDVGEVARQLAKTSNIEAYFIDAIRSKNTAIAKLFIDSIPQHDDEYLNSEYLMEAVIISKDNKDILELLLQRNDIDVNAEHYGNAKTALIYAVENVSPSVIEMLINKGADVNKVTNATSALMVAAKLSKPAISTILLKEYNANPNIVDKHGESALMKSSNAKVIEILVENGANLNLTAGKAKRAAVDYMLDSKNDELVCSLVRATAIHKDFQDLEKICDRVVLKNPTLKDKLKETLEEVLIDRAIIDKLNLEHARSSIKPKKLIKTVFTAPTMEH